MKVELELSKEEIAHIVSWIGTTFDYGTHKLRDELRIAMFIGLREQGMRPVAHGRYETKAEHCSMCDAVCLFAEGDDGLIRCSNCGCH